MIRHKLVQFRDMCGVYVLTVLTRVLKYQIFFRNFVIFIW